MFGFFKKKNKPVKKIDKRNKQRRSNTDPRRDEIRWEPEKTERRGSEDRRKGNNTWDGKNK
ncbi:hypothetical protein MNBD_GAMMA02-1121 [hydrothermal vent metagenome]|uniref:Uncharacterized protein n=1 Tax=hydrothermal vent metagenome TaxID=652676 RepID=A0A3B0W4H9_9ZZZZ